MTQKGNYNKKKSDLLFIQNFIDIWAAQIPEVPEVTKNLVIVESPAKAKTIEGYLGKDFKVTSSYGGRAEGLSHTGTRCAYATRRVHNTICSDFE